MYTYGDLTMSIFEGILYGLLQGIAEFLPISSSGHLALAQNLFGAADTEGTEYLAFNVLLHFATLLAVCTVYRKDVWLVIKGFFSLLKKIFKKQLNLKRLDYGEKLFVMLVFATLPLVPAILIKDWLEAVSSASWAIGLLLIINGAVLFVSDKLASNKFTVAKANPVKAFYPGIAQVFGLLPGISRSGITITGSLLGGFNRKDAVKLSFLMSIPAILGAGVLELPDFFKDGIPAQSALPFIIGAVVAAVSGFGAIKLLQYVAKNKGFSYFSLYCIGAGIFAIIADVII